MSNRAELTIPSEYRDSKDPLIMQVHGDLREFAADYPPFALIACGDDQELGQAIVNANLANALATIPSVKEFIRKTWNSFLYLGKPNWERFRGFPGKPKDWDAAAFVLTEYYGLAWVGNMVSEGRFRFLEKDIEFVGYITENALRNSQAGTDYFIAQNLSTLAAPDIFSSLFEGVNEGQLQGPYELDWVERVRQRTGVMRVSTLSSMSKISYKLD